jgi:peptide subunit release factor 1 (eRF1)
MKVIDIRRYLQGSNILTVIQVGAEDYRPVVNDSWTEHTVTYQDDKGNVEEVKEAIINGAAAKLIVSESYLMQNRDKTEEVLSIAEKNGCEVEIISSRNPQEKQIFGFGGIVVTLRYKVN